MKTNVTFNQIATELVNIFSNEARVTEYSAQGGTMRQGLCGWCGVMSPLNRLAFVEDFGAQTVTLAEVEARRRMADKAKEYAATNHAAHVAEANQNEQRNAAPVAGSFVWAVETGLKNEGQGMAGVIADAVEGYDVSRRLVCVERVINATASDFLRPSLADELVRADAERGEKFPGGSRNDDDSYTDFFDNYKTWYTVAAAVVDPSGRWFLIDAEGYDYARYILMPTNWGEQFATEKAAAEQKKADREEQERREAEQQAADRLAAYVERCNKWAHLMTDLRPLVAAEKAAAEKYGYRSKEAKAAARKLQAARRGNVSAMVRAAFPGLRLSMTVNNGWGSAYDLTYYDGPTRHRFDNETDLDLFEAIAYTFDGMTDSADFDRHEFTDFSEKYFACNYGGVKVDREQSDENAAAMLAAIVETVPAAADNEPREWTADELQAVAARLGCDAHELAHRLANYRQTLTASNVARIAFYICDFATQKPQEPTTPTDPTNGKANAVEAATSDENAPAEGLELVEIAGGVAVIGDSRTTYRNRREIKAHGARWNRDAQQWQATTPEAVEQLRQWFGVAQDEQPEPTTETNDTPTTATEAAQAAETATDDQQTTDTAESAPEATESGKKYVFAFAQFGDLKEKHPDRLLLFRCGDFYECYQQDAHTAADLLGIITTDRPDGVTVCAFYHSKLDAYLPRIIRAGHLVAICDQLQDAPTEAAQAPETTTTDQQPAETPKAQQSAQEAPKSESDGGELFTLDGETFRRGDRVTIFTVDTYDAHTSTEAGTLTDYSRSMATAEVTTDDGRQVYGWFGSVKHDPTDPTPTPGGKGVEGEAQTAKENETPVIGSSDSHRICTAQDGISPDGIEADAQTVALPDTFGDLCWDTYGKASAIVFGNIDDHAAQLEALGGVRREVNYSPLHAGKAKRGDRMEAYYFDKRHARNAGPYVARINHALQNAVWKACQRIEKQAADYKAGDRVRTIYGPGVVIDGGGLHAPSKNCVWVRLDGTTYNYGPKGLPHTFVEVSASDMMAEGESPRYRASGKSPIPEKQKSGHDLMKQAERLIDRIASDYWATTNEDERARMSKRMSKIADIQHRYNRRIAKHFHEETDYLSNDNYVKPVGREIYMERRMTV